MPVELADSEHAVCWVVPMELAILVTLHLTGVLGNQLSERTGQILSGRDARIAHQSWLI